MVIYHAEPKAKIIFLAWLSLILCVIRSEFSTVSLILFFYCRLLTQTGSKDSSFFKLMFVSHYFGSSSCYILPIIWLFLCCCAWYRCWARIEGSFSNFLMYLDFCRIISRLQLSFLDFLENSFSKKREFTAQSSSNFFWFPEMSIENLLLPFFKMQTMH